MISMPQVQSIRRLRRNGESVASIARKTHVSEPTADCIPSVTGMYFTTYNRDMGEITMEPAYHGIEEETVTRLPSKAFDEFLKALDRPVPQTARDLIGMEPDWL